MSQHTEHMPCGCSTTTYDDDVPASYDPCLACALKNAGIMLMEAGKRMAEAIEAERLEAEKRAEADRQRAEDWIGGTD